MGSHFVQTVERYKRPMFFPNSSIKTMGLVTVKRNFPRLKELKGQKASLRKYILTQANAELVNCICECCLNVLNGNVKITKKQRKALLPYGKILRALAQRGVPVETRRQRILQRGGSFLPSLLTPILLLLAKLLKHG